MFVFIMLSCSTSRSHYKPHHKKKKKDCGCSSYTCTDKSPDKENNNIIQYYNC